MIYEHRNASTETPTEVGHFWFKGLVNDSPVAEKVTIMKWKDIDRYAAIGVAEGSDLSTFVGLWWGPEKDVPPWEDRLYIEDWREDSDDNLALARLLEDEIVYTIDRLYQTKVFKWQESKLETTMVIFVLCNDLFAWGAADAESLDDIKGLYKMHMADQRWGYARWCCIHRNEQPQDPVKIDMIKDGTWDEVMEALPENFHSKAIRERNKQ